MVQMNSSQLYCHSISFCPNIWFLYRFAFQKDSAGAVTSVTHTSVEGMSSLALKKTIASLFSLSQEEELVERKKTIDSNLKLVYSFNDTLERHARESRKVCTKV